MINEQFDVMSGPDVAQAYGGNKADIARAVENGLLSPVSAALAGMFIDKMVVAQMPKPTEITTVMEDVLNTGPGLPSIQEETVMEVGEGLPVLPSNLLN